MYNDIFYRLCHLFRKSRAAGQQGSRAEMEQGAGGREKR